MRPCVRRVRAARVRRSRRVRGACAAQPARATWQHGVALSAFSRTSGAVRSGPISLSLHSRAVYVCRLQRARMWVVADSTTSITVVSIHMAHCHSAGISLGLAVPCMFRPDFLPCVRIESRFVCFLYPALFVRRKVWKLYFKPRDIEKELIRNHSEISPTTSSATDEKPREPIDISED